MYGGDVQRAMSGKRTSTIVLVHRKQAALCALDNLREENDNADCFMHGGYKIDSFRCDIWAWKKCSNEIGL